MKSQCNTSAHSWEGQERKRGKTPVLEFLHVFPDAHMVLVGCAQVKPLWQVAWQCLPELSTAIPCDPTALLLSTCPTQMGICELKDTPRKFTAALFVIPRKPGATQTAVSNRMHEYVLIRLPSRMLYSKENEQNTKTHNNTDKPHTYHLNKRSQAQKNCCTVRFYFYKVQTQNNCVKYTRSLAQGRQRLQGNGMRVGDLRH